MSSVERVRLDVYRSCSRQEKREVLDAFWRTDRATSSRIHLAALQYGPYAAASLVVVVLELALVIAVSVHRSKVTAGLASLVAVVALISLGWSILRYRTLQRRRD